MTYDDVTLAWIAGFFDGEGCVFAHHTYEPKVRKNGRHTYRLQITISNNNQSSLDYIQMMFGGSVNVKGTYQKCQHWRLCGRDKQKVFLKAILPYLKIKKPQAELALRFLDTVVDNSCGFRTPEHIIVVRQEIMAALKAEKRK